jgi:8-oxo-dGTP diphosphatase
MTMPLKWEFPGGKIQTGETPEDCIRRELLEELGVKARVGQALPPSTHSYPDFTITLYPFLCVLESGELTPLEHEEIAWMEPQDLLRLDWAEADRPVVNALLEMPIGDSE